MSGYLHDTGIKIHALVDLAGRYATNDTKNDPMAQTYKKSGVDIDAGDRFVDLIAPAARSTYRKEVLGGVGPCGRRNI